MLEFQTVADSIVAKNPGLEGCRAVVEKELLHFEILGGMHAAGLLKHLAFKGGTCLRLCHGAVRLSEDLDFSGGAAFEPVLLQDMETVLRDRIGKRYGLKVTVTPPKPMRSINRWIARVVTRPPSPSGSTALMGVQRIKIEVDDTPHPEGVTTERIGNRYEQLEGQYAAPVIRCVPMRDVLADKLVALPVSVAQRRNPRHRDVWDILWLAPRVEDHDAAVASARAKARESGLTDGEYATVRENLVDRAGELVESEAFASRLEPFFARDVFERTIGNADYRKAMTNELKRLFARFPTPGPTSPASRFG